MTLEEAKAEFEKRFASVVLGLPTNICQTGEPYDVCYVRCEIAEEWLKAAIFIARDKTGSLYWRVEPELLMRPPRIYSRFAVTDKPIIYPDLDALDASRAAQGEMQ